MNSLRIYFAGPLFSLAEREHNLRVVRFIENLAPGHGIAATCVLPQVSGDVFLPDLTRVVQDCLAQVAEADVVVACFDGSDVDAGTAMEVGFALGVGTPVIGYRTDFREGEVDGVSAMLRYGCQAYVQVPASSGSYSELAHRLCNALAAHRRKGAGTRGSC